MTSRINKALFGDAIDFRIHNKLVARQKLAENAIQPNTSAQVGEDSGFISGPDKKFPTFEEAIGTSNFKRGGMFLADLSSRTPWARAWVAVEVYSRQEALDKLTKTITTRTPGKAPTYKWVTHEVITDAQVAYALPGDIRPTSADNWTDKHGRTVENRTERVMVDPGYSSVTEREVVTIREAQEAFENTLAKKVYVLGNHNLNQLVANNNINNPIIGNPEVSLNNTAPGAIAYSAADGPPEEETIDISDAFPHQMQSNTFKKPHAGIISIDSKTEGPIGATKRTTVNFVVHNYEDFQNIYSKYFLKPGANVFLDFGWDTANINNLYSPQQLIESNEDVREYLYSENGPLDSAAGDMETVIGKVTNFSTSIDENGSFICSMELVSDNAALLDYEISEESKLKRLIVDNIGTLLINTAATQLGAGFLRKDFTSDKVLRLESETYAATFAHGVASGGGFRSTIGPDATKLGIYWRGFAPKGSKDQPTFDFEYFDWGGTESSQDLGEYTNDELIQEQYGSSGPGGGSPKAYIQTVDEFLYVSWGFFEEEFLNKHISNGKFEKGPTSGGYYNSGRSMTTFDKDLYERQQVTSLYDPEFKISFLYPEDWTVTYNTINHLNKMSQSTLDGSSAQASKIPLYASFTHINGITTDPNDPNNRETIHKWEVEQAKKSGAIPFRELFVSVALIKESFNKHENVQDALEAILEQLNVESYGIFNLKFMSATDDNAGLTVVDINHFGSINSENDKSETAGKYNDLFMFHPYAKGSIVKNMDIDFTTPSNGIQNMVAIQNTPAEYPLYPFTASERNNEAMRKIYRFMETNNTSLGVRHLPHLDKTAADTSGQKNATVGVDASKNLLEKNPNTKNIIEQYKGSLRTNALSVQTGDIVVRDIQGLGLVKSFQNEYGKELYEGMYDNKYFGYSPDDPETSAEVSASDEDDIVKFDPDAYYAESLYELYKYKALGGFLKEKVSPWIPMITLTLETYGIAGIIPGDIFNIEYLPEQYQNKTYFTVVSVNQVLDSGGWFTKFDSQLRVRNGSYQQGLQKDKRIFLHPNWIMGLNQNSHVTDHFRNFEPTSKTTDGLMILRAEGRKKGPFDPEKTFSTNAMRRMYKYIMRVWCTEFAGSFSKIQQREKVKGWGQKQNIIVSGDTYPYLILLWMRGAIAIPISEEWWIKGGMTDPAGLNFQAGGLSAGFGSLGASLFSGQMGRETGMKGNIDDHMDKILEKARNYESNIDRLIFTLLATQHMTENNMQLALTGGDGYVN